MSARWAEGSPHAPEKPVPPPTIGFRININGLIQGPEVKLSLVVGKEIQQAEKFPGEREGWVLLKIPRGDIDGVGEVK